MLKALLIAVLSVVGSSTAAIGATQEPPPARVRAQLLSPCSEVVAGQLLQVALALEIDADWHVYWRNPGEAGGPPRLELLGSEDPVLLSLIHI